MATPELHLEGKEEKLPMAPRHTLWVLCGAPPGPVSQVRPEGNGSGHIHVDMPIPASCPAPPHLPGTQLPKTMACALTQALPERLSAFSHFARFVTPDSSRRTPGLEGSLPEATHPGA